MQSCWAHFKIKPWNSFASHCVNFPPQSKNKTDGSRSGPCLRAWKEPCVTLLSGPILNFCSLKTTICWKGSASVHAFRYPELKFCGATMAAVDCNYTNLPLSLSLSLSLSLAHPPYHSLCSSLKPVHRLPHGLRAQCLTLVNTWLIWSMWRQIGNTELLKLWTFLLYMLIPPRRSHQMKWPKTCQC